MIVSWNWLADYLDLSISMDEVLDRLTMSGLNLEGTESFGDDVAVDLEVTSNRGDCLGHIGVAREIAVLFDLDLSYPAPNPKSGSTDVNGITNVTIDCPDLCFNYTARVIRGAKVGESPDWLKTRLTSVFGSDWKSVNNVVDITNFVLMECAQPLHAFDLSKLAGHEIIVREAQEGEILTAIDHRDYSLVPGMCVIADSEKPVALGGVMGGADSEVTSETSDLLIESARFAPLSVRTTARRLKLHSPSSYRFERGVDPKGVDWASRRCCEMILELCGGELADGVIDVGPDVKPREPITLRASQLLRILGIEVEQTEVRRILTALGNEEQSADDQTVTVIPPTWRADLTREIDLVEEVARIHGYDKIPEDAAVAMSSSHKLPIEKNIDRIREVLVASGLFEAMTRSVVSKKWLKAYSPWSDADPLVSGTPMVKGEDRVRTTIVPSLLEARRFNESKSNKTIELFEIARIYLPEKDSLPREELMIAICSGRSFGKIKGIVQGIVAHVSPASKVTSKAYTSPLYTDEAAELYVDGKLLGIVGCIDAKYGKERFGVRSECTVAELFVNPLSEIACSVRTMQSISDFPAMTRDINMIFDEPTLWSDVESRAEAAGGELLDGLRFQEVIRFPERDGGGKKRILFSISLRSDERTLSGNEADEVHKNIVDSLQSELGGELVGA